MSLDLVRIQVEVLEPGAVIAGNTNISMYLNPPRPFVSWPNKPAYGLDKGFDSVVIKEDDVQDTYPIHGNRHGPYLPWGSGLPPHFAY